MKFYKEDFPEKDDLILGKIIDISKYGINVVLPEYNNKTAFLNFKDVTQKKKMYHIKKIIKKNKLYPFTVINIDIEKEIIDISKRYQEKEEEDSFMTFYKNYKKCILVINNFIRKIDKHHENNIQNIQNLELKYFNSILWKYDKNEIYKYFEKIKEREIIENIFDISNEEFNLLKAVIDKTFLDKKCTIKMYIKINSLHLEGFEKIKSFLNIIESEEKITPVIGAVPIYILEYKNILFREKDNFIKQKKEYLKKLEKKDILFNLDKIDIFE